MSAQFVAGTTEPLTFQLLENGVPLALTGYTVTLLLSDRTGAVVLTSGLVAVTSAANGLVTFTPAALTVTAALSPYSARWVLTEDANSKVSYVPSGPRDVWNVVGA